MKPKPTTSADTDRTDEAAITRCPACGTLFRVFEAQLTVSKGWARCGQCHEVFNAELHLVDEITSTGDALTEVGMHSATVRPSPPETGLRQLDAEHQTPSENDASFPRSAMRNDAGDQSELPEADYAYEIEEATRERDRGQSNGTQASAIAGEPVSQQKLPVAGLLPTADSQSASAQPSFMSSKRSSAQHGWVGWFGVLGLAAALMIQALWFWRSEVASQWPKASPWLSQVCNALGCSVEAPRRLAALQLDSVSVSPIDSGAVYLLRMLIKTRTELAIASPSVELSLQASDESLITRRVLTAQDLGLHPDVLPPNSEHSVSLVIAIESLPGLTAQKVASYAALAFYP